MAYFKNNWFLIRLTSIFVALALLPTCSQALVQFDDQEQIEKIGIETTNKLKLNHYRYIKIDDKFSDELFDQYLSKLDPNKNYLLQSDLTQINQYRLQLDDALTKGDLAPALTIFNIYQQRLENRLEWIINILNQGVEQFDFTLDETLNINYEARHWAISESQLNDRWRKSIKLAVLNLKLADKPEPDIAKLLIKRYKNQLERAHQTNIHDVFQLYMNIVSQKYDPHTEYFAPRRSENFNINMRLSLDGIGAILQSDQEFTKVVRLVPGGPADLSGQLKPLDKITGVAQGDKGKMVDVIGWRLDDVVKLIRGPKDTVVRLQLIPKSAENDMTSTEISIVRNKVLLEEQAASKSILEVTADNKTWKIGIITIPTFYLDFDAYHAGDANYKSTTRDVRKLLAELEKEQVNGIVIDLRNNGGGSLNESNTLTGLFIHKGPTVQIKDSKGRVQIFNDPNAGVSYSGPLAVMVNRLSASASEIFAGAIQDYQRGIIIGSQTFGKGTVQTLLPLTEGQLKITQAKFYRISGNSTQHLGVTPDISLPNIIDHNDIGEDALDNALPWDSIRPLLYKPLDDFNPTYTDVLKTKHIERIKSVPDYQFKLAQISWLEKSRDRTEISLNEKKRIIEREENKQWQLDQENKRRTQQGQELIASFAELEKDNKNKLLHTSDPQDAYLTETAQILVDSIQLQQRHIAAH